MIRIQYMVVALLLLGSTAMGQNLVDGLRYSDYRIKGTARSAAMGNAFGALGGDFTSASINPAGLGVYRSSEFVVTPSFGKTDVDATYLGQTTNDSKYNIGLPNVGYVATLKNNSGGSVVGLSFGVGYNRLNNYNMKRMISASNATSSMLDEFALNADGYLVDQLDPYYEQLAADTKLIYTEDDGPEGIYRHDMQKFPYTDDLTNYEHDQRKSFSQKGAIDEFLLSFAANFNHKFYLGATVGIHDVNFKENTSLSEYGNAQIPIFNNYSFNTYLNTTGTGFNFKIGAIYKPVDALRLGVALHTPTFYNLHDAFDNAMFSDIDFGEKNYSAYSPLGDYDYDLTTPMKAIFSAAYVIGKSAIISVDYEYVDYSTIKLSDGGNGYDFFDENQEIKNAYRSVGNLHLGAEYRVNSLFSLRAGYEHFPSPINAEYQSADGRTDDAVASTISAGLGFRQGGFFMDAAYKHGFDRNYAEVYSGSDLAQYEITKDQLLLTIGFRF
ncbi:OmpP1/FadL family transporter [Sunxiuqinia elliptica]|nr:outer membrane protein transport protein [Sunxiuqinia elliptica]